MQNVLTLKVNDLWASSGKKLIYTSVQVAR